MNHRCLTCLDLAVHCLQVAHEKSDLVIFTNDSPATEDPSEIISVCFRLLYNCNLQCNR